MMLGKTLNLALLLGALVPVVVGFAPAVIQLHGRGHVSTKTTTTLYTTAKEQHIHHLEDLAHKLRLRAFDVDTGSLLLINAYSSTRSNRTTSLH